jgi:sugar lactone lactonase YvrE
MTHSLKHLFLCASVSLLVACGSQEGKNTDAAGVYTASEATKTVATQTTETTTVGTSPKRDLLANLEIAYPGGVLPAERAAAAAEQLTQNPAALKFNANSATISPQAGAIRPQAGVIRPQAASTYTVGLSAPVQRAQNTTLFGSYFFSIYDFEMVNALAANPTWNLEGTAFYASLDINPGLAPVYRFRNLLNGSYLYTIDDGEKNDIIANYSAYFVLEGPAWYASPEPATGFSPLYRFRNLTNGTYLFSAYEAEKDAIVANYAGIFLLEGISYYVQQTAPIELSLLAGSGVSGSDNGTGAAASFSNVVGVVHDSAGNMFVTDLDNHTIRKITPAGEVSTYAGAQGESGDTNGDALTARFNNPWGITIDSADNLYVAEVSSNTIRKITPAGVVSLFAGSPDGLTGTVDAMGAAARFSSPAGLAIDAANNLYVADGNNHTIRKITPSGLVSTVAGLAGMSGIADGISINARFNTPLGVTTDATGTLYVADTQNSTVRKITPAGVVTTLAGRATVAGSADGVGSAARFFAPYGIKLDAAGNVYVADTSNTTVRKITPDGSVSTVVSAAGSTLFSEGLLPATVGEPTYGLDIYGGQLFIGTNTRVLKVSGLP